MKKKLIVLSGFVMSLAPAIVLAAEPITCGSGIFATNPGQTTIGSIICKVNQIINGLVPVLIALGVVYFIWGVISYVVGADEEAKSKGRDRMIYGIIGLAVIVAVWGLVNVLTRTFGVDAPTQVTPPAVPSY